ncbi:hypothetical protein TCDM_13100 [Trypanosoma cruzi Dm28c]|uniref:Uncharacterized protein n=1 Tax=Trypanosoma cruzi Dm28c TaxID=1416333 RepID=V5AP60_TRYCR|nr:hypothetical protein TCDM_13100 [Trypanosoma cruzi Dm28c]
MGALNHKIKRKTKQKAEAWDDQRTHTLIAPVKQNTHTEGEKEECVCGRCTALSHSLSRGHHRSSSHNNKKQKREVL